MGGGGGGGAGHGAERVRADHRVHLIFVCVQLDAEVYQWRPRVVVVEQVDAGALRDDVPVLLRGAKLLDQEVAAAAVWVVEALVGELEMNQV